MKQCLLPTMKFLMKFILSIPAKARTFITLNAFSNQQTVGPLHLPLWGHTLARFRLVSSSKKDPPPARSKSAQNLNSCTFPLPALHCTAPSIIEFFKYYTYIPLPPPPPPPPPPEWTGKVDKEKLLTQLARFCLLFKFGSSFRVRPRSVDCTWRTPWRHPVAVNRQQNTNGCFDGVHPNGRPSLVKRLPCILRFCLNLDLTKKMSNCQKSSASLLGVLSMFLINVELFTKRGSAGR